MSRLVFVGGELPDLSDGSSLDDAIIPGFRAVDLQTGALENLDPSSGTIGLLFPFATEVGDEVFGILQDGADPFTNTASFYRTDGTVPGTSDLFPINAVTVIVGAVADSLVLLQGPSLNEPEAAFLDTTTETLVQVTEFGPADGVEAIQFAMLDEGSLFDDLATLDGRVFFATSANRFSIDAGGFVDEEDLFITDGTPEGTEVLGTFTDLFTSNSGTAVFDGEFFFAAETSDEGTEPWVTDGTPEGTRLIADLFPGAGNLASSFPQEITATDTGVFFIGRQESALPVDQDVYVTDGETVTNLTAFAGTAEPFGVIPQALTAVKDKLFFLVNFESGGGEGELFVSDGTTAGTGAVVEGPDVPVVRASSLTPFGDSLLFAASDLSTPWISDGTTDGTFSLVGPDAPYVPTVAGLDFTVVGDQAFFFAGDGTTFGDLDLWVTDGTAEGTNVAIDFTRPIDPVVSFILANGDEAVVFVSSGSTPDGLIDPAVWVTDGTPDGTRLVSDDLPDELTVLSDFFILDTDETSEEPTVYPDPTTLSLSVDTAAITETGTAIGTITRSGSTEDALVVTLMTSDTAAATVPASVTIPGGEASATFLISATDDDAIDGDQIATITASAAGADPVQTTITVENDDEHASVDPVPPVDPVEPVEPMPNLFDVTGDGDFLLDMFGTEDIILTDSELPDLNGDGVITFGRNGVLDLDGPDAGERVVDFGGTVPPTTGVQFIGEVERDGESLFLYMDARADEAQIAAAIDAADALFA